MKKGLKIGGDLRRPDTFKSALKDSLKQPYIGVTQGGSSRKNSGARVAATISQAKPK